MKVRRERERNKKRKRSTRCISKYHKRRRKGTFPYFLLMKKILMNLLERE